MTTPEDYENYLLKGLAALNSKAPANSKVLVMGLVDGRILWNESKLSNFLHVFDTTCVSGTP